MTHGLYWGGSASDIAVKEALWQRSLWSRAQQNILAPAQVPIQNPSQELFALFGPSAPRPMPVLYFYCQCSMDDRKNLLLRFGGTNQPPDALKVDSLSQQPMADRPLIFANACTTTASDPYRLNTLEAYFFRQQCRAFLGTVTKVPIQFASRFAVIFFHFFYRQADPAPISAGESVAQTRLFLWTEYRNLGGLFYAYINHYDLFMADDAELQALRH